MNKIKKVIKVTLGIGSLGAIAYVASRYFYNRGLTAGKKEEFDDIYALAITSPKNFFEMLEYVQDLTNLSDADITDLKLKGETYRVSKMKDLRHA